MTSPIAAARHGKTMQLGLAALTAPHRRLGVLRTVDPMGAPLHSQDYHLLDFSERLNTSSYVNVVFEPVPGLVECGWWKNRPVAVGVCCRI